MLTNGSKVVFRNQTILPQMSNAAYTSLAYNTDRSFMVFTDNYTFTDTVTLKTTWKMMANFSQQCGPNQFYRNGQCIGCADQSGNFDSQGTSCITC
jgi:hypothetical protein